MRAGLLHKEMLFQVLKHAPGAQSFCVEPELGAAAFGAPDLIERILSTANHLYGCGVRAGDRVLFCGDQGLAAFVAFWATIATGAALVPVDTAWPSFMCQRGLAKIKPRLAIIDASLEKSPWHEFASEVRLLPIDADGRLRDSSSTGTFAPVDMAGDTPAACLFTSGSTADPKVVVLSREALLQSAKLVAQSFEWSSGERLLNLPDPHTMSGLRNAFLAAPLAGMRWACAPRIQRPDIFSLIDLLQSVQAHRVVAAPLLLRHINLMGDRVGDSAFSSTLALYCTGANLNSAEVEQFYARFQIPVINYYGLTETVGLCLAQRLAKWRPDDQSIGHPVACEIRVVDDQGIEVARGGDGELQVRQRFPMSGYLDEAAASAECFIDGWLRTGDLARRRPDGSVLIVGRRATFIKTPTTEKIHPQEIEAVLEQHGSISEAAVCGLPDRAGGERIAALLVANSGYRVHNGTHSDLAQFVTERLGSARAPTAIRWVSTIPRSTNGKIIRSQLRDRFNE
jgi:acyl-coenzyme A synthetase/AMP-(fatty) acid ligase